MGQGGHAVRASTSVNNSAAEPVLLLLPLHLYMALVMQSSCGRCLGLSPSVGLSVQVANFPLTKQTSAQQQYQKLMTLRQVELREQAHFQVSCSCVDKAVPSAVQGCPWHPCRYLTHV